MSPRLQRLAPPGKPDLTVESPYAPITIPPAVCLLQALGSRASPMQPISASTYEHTAARTRRKWGERGGGESIVAFAANPAAFSAVWVRNWYIFGEMRDSGVLGLEIRRPAVNSPGGGWLGLPLST